MRRGFSLIELLIVVVIMGLLASIAVPAYRDAQAAAYDTVALADLKSTMYAMESYVARHQAFPTEAELMTTGFSLSPGVSFLEYKIQDYSESTRVHIHIAHEGSPRYYHVEYPSSPPPELNWKKKK